MHMKAGLIAGAALLAATALWAQQAAAPPAGYVGTADLVDSTRYLPPPPVPGSLAEKADREALATAKTNRDPAAWRNAVADLHFNSPEAQVRMSCAINAKLTPENAPAFFRLSQRAGADLGAATFRAKDAWKRPRPFSGESTPETCYPDADIKKGLGWSYPSGHSAAGWLWGMILSQVVPDRAAEALSWGRSVGDGRVVCRVHFPSDVVAGRVLAGAVLAQMAVKPDFRADIDAARAEVAAVRAKGEPVAGCAS